MRRHSVLPIVSVANLLFVVCAPGASGGLPEGAVRLERADIYDNSGFGRPMKAVSIFVPAGWSASGGIVWQSNGQPCGPNGTRIEWRADSPDGVSAIELLPEETWAGNNLQMQLPEQTCPNVSITNVKDYLNWYVQRVRPGAHILDYRDRPDIVQSLEHLNRSETTVGGELRSWIEAGELLLAFNVSGRDMRESLAVIVFFTLNRMAGVMPGEVRDFLTISTSPALAFRKPHGQLDFKLAETIRRSMKNDPEWAAEMAVHNQKMAGIAAKGAADRHAIRMQTAQEIAEINRQGYENRQASNDRSHEQFVQTIRGVDTYVDTTSNERIELPDTHDHIWRLNDDTYIFTNDINFDPNRDLGIEGREMKAAE